MKSSSLLDVFVLLWKGPQYPVRWEATAYLIWCADCSKMRQSGQEKRKTEAVSYALPSPPFFFDYSCIQVTFIIMSVCIQQGYSYITVNSCLRALNIQNKTQSYDSIPHPS